MSRDSSPRALRHAIALGLLQGPSELLPISSSAHTSVIPWLAGWPYGELDGELRKSFEVALHAGAGLALAIDMRGELIREASSVDGRRLAVIVLSVQLATSDPTRDEPSRSVANASRRAGRAHEADCSDPRVVLPTSASCLGAGRR